MGGLVADIEGGMHLVFADVNRVAGAKNLFLGADPLLDFTADAGDDFFLVGMLVEVMPLAWKEFDIDDGEVLVAGGGGTAEPSEVPPVEFFGGRF